MAALEAMLQAKSARVRARGRRRARASSSPNAARGLTFLALSSQFNAAPVAPGWQREKDTDPARWGEFEYQHRAGERIVIQESYSSTGTRVSIYVTRAGAVATRALSLIRRARARALPRLRCGTAPC